MSERGLLLLNGVAVNGQVVEADSADFEELTWTFSIDQSTRVSAGKFLLIPMIDLERAAAGKPASLNNEGESK